MSDVQSNVKPLTLTTGRVIFAIAGVYVTQSLVSALSMQSLPALVRAAGGSLALAGATTLFMLPWALKFIWAPWIERWRLPPGSQERRSRMLILRGQVALAAILTIAAAIGWFGREGGFPDTQIVALFVLFMVAGTVASTIDIASDGFCVDQLTRTGYGWGNSVQVGGSTYEFDTEAISCDGPGLETNELSTGTIQLSSSDIPAAVTVNWHFQGSYGGTELETISASGTVS